MTAPQITVLIDTYNYGEYIEEAINSVLAQNFPAEQREILVVDDGSTDDTAERMHKFEGLVTYLRKPNGGQASAINFGLARARGQIVALLDADDYWLPGKLQRIAEEFEGHPDAGMVYHAIRELNSREGAFRDVGVPRLSGFLPAKTKDLLSHVLYPTSFLAFRRSALELLLPIPEKLTIQADGHLSGLIVFVAPIIAVPECLAVYRIHGANLFAGDGRFNRRRQELRLRTRTALNEGMRHWLTERNYDLRRSDLQRLAKQWDLAQTEHAFVLSPPGRLAGSRHWMQYAGCGSPLTWRHRTVAYLNAAGSLVVGYHNVHKLDEWRIAIKRAFRSPSKTLSR